MWIRATLTAAVARYMWPVTPTSLHGFFRERADGRELVREGFWTKSEIKAFSERTPNFRSLTTGKSRAVPKLPSSYFRYCGALSYVATLVF